MLDLPHRVVSPARSPARRVILLTALALAPLAARAAEYRAQWVDAFHNGYLSASQVSTTVANLRAGNCNVFIPEVRVYADAYYVPNAAAYPDPGNTIVANGKRIVCDLASDPEPRKSNTYDALAECIRQAHDTSGGQPRLDVWAWLVSFRSGSAMASKHPEWLTRDAAGSVVSTDFDPGHPGAAQQLVNVCMDILSRYNVDGLHFDYIRFTDPGYGYNPVSVARFNARYGRTGTPSNTDPLWTQWRRDQVTNVLRKVYLMTIARRPSVKVSAATVTWYPAPARPTSTTNYLAAWKTGFQSTRPYDEAYQDWRSWMEEGILDIAVPMAYFTECSYPATFDRWADFTKDNQFNRQAMIGPGTYLNTLDDALDQLKRTRTASSPGGKYIAGQSLYSYASPYASSCGGTIVANPSAMATALRTQAVPDPLNPNNPQPMYPTPAPLPDMPRLTNGKGHLMGTVTDLRAPKPGWVDGVLVTVSGPVTRSIRTDGTGFYGFVDLPPGDYRVTVASTPGAAGVSQSVTVTAGHVATLNVAVPPYTLWDAALAARIAGGITAATADDARRLDLATGNDAPGALTLPDAVAVARKVAGLQ